MAEPEDTPVATPDVVTVATPVVALVHVPPVMLGVTVPVAPWQMLPGPLIVGMEAEETVTDKREVSLPQLLIATSIIVASPGATYVTLPDASMVHIAVESVYHVGLLVPPEAVTVVVVPEQAVLLPEMVPATG